MGEKGCGDDDGLGLSLRLGCAVETHQPNLHLNLMHSPPSLSMMHHHHLQHHKSSIWNETFQSYDRSPELSRDETRSFMRGGIDVNRRPSMVECDDEAVVSSPNSTISSISGKRSERDQGNGDDTEAERASCSRGLSDDEDGGGGDGDGDAARKKLRLSKDQSAVLEDTFKEHSTLNPKQKLALAKQLNLRPRQVEVWFQNRRARTKLKQTEVDCEYLKRCCDNLTEENRRLQKEVQELRALKLSPQMYMHMNPPTTLTMCPSCERVAVSSSSSSAAAAAAAVGDTHHHRHPVGPHHQRPVPINPWATTPIQRRP